MVDLTRPEPGAHTKSLKHLMSQASTLFIMPSLAQAVHDMREIVRSGIPFADFGCR